MLHICHYWLFPQPPSKEGDQSLEPGAVHSPQRLEVILPALTQDGSILHSCFPLLQDVLEHLVISLTRAVPPVLPHAGYFSQTESLPSFWPCSSVSRDLLPSLNTKIRPPPSSARELQAMGKAARLSMSYSLPRRKGRLLLDRWMFLVQNTISHALTFT